MASEVRYCTAEDGVRIAYTVQGEGPPLLVVPLFLESFSLEHMVPEQQAFWRRMGERRRLIRFDIRGTGLSQRDVADLSYAGLVRDLEAVVQATGLERLSVWGETTGGNRAIEYAVRYPDKVDRLILYGTTARPTEVMPPQNLDALAVMARSNWTLATQVLADIAGRRQVPEALEGFADMYLQTATGDVAARILEATYSGDVSHLLPQVQAETLVLHRRDDPLFPFANGQSLAAGIARAHFVPLEGNVHPASMGDPESILSAVARFLGGDHPQAGPAPAPAQTPFRTVLFTDIVGHTQMMQRLGDQRGREVLREHERISREVLKAHGGTEVKTMGDGFMASFGSVTGAVKCAIALQRAFEERNASDGEPLHIRVGLNAGEPIEDEGDLFGATVILAARIAARAKGGEILASDVVRGLCSGKGFLFADRGDEALRGFEEPVRIFEINWRS